MLPLIALFHRGAGLEKKSGHIVELQSVRGIAAFIVMFGHPLGFFASPPNTWFYIGLFNGNACVVIFFVLSGYVLSRSLWAKIPTITIRAVAEFYVRRFFRISPALWVAGLVAIFYIVFLHGLAPDRFVTAVNAEKLREPITALGAVGTFAGVFDKYNPPTWSILVEMIGSILVPLFCFLLRQYRIGFVILAMGLLVLSVTGNHTGPILYLVDFAAGASLCSITIKSPALLWQHRIVRTTIMVVAILVLVIAVNLQNFGLPFRFMHLLESVAAFLLIGGIVVGKIDIPVLRHPSLIWLGDISYSVYLIHFPILISIAKLLAILRWDYYEPQYPMLFKIALAIILAVITLLVSAWLYKNVEVPGIELGARVIRLWRRTAPA